MSLAKTSLITMMSQPNYFEVVLLVSIFLFGQLMLILVIFDPIVVVIVIVNVAVYVLAVVLIIVAVQIMFGCDQ